LKSFYKVANISERELKFLIDQNSDVSSDFQSNISERLNKPLSFRFLKLKRRLSDFEIRVISPCSDLFDHQKSENFKRNFTPMYKSESFLGAVFPVFHHYDSEIELLRGFLEDLFP
jgi:hypothetical protein